MDSCNFYANIFNTLATRLSVIASKGSKNRAVKTRYKIGYETFLSLFCTLSWMFWPFGTASRLVNIGWAMGQQPYFGYRYQFGEHLFVALSWVCPFVGRGEALGGHTISRGKYRIYGG